MGHLDAGAASESRPLLRTPPIPACEERGDREPPTRGESRRRFGLPQMEPRALLLLLAVLKGVPGKPHVVKTRGIIELAGAIHCSTGRSAFAYLGYGCYCGLGGQGWPRDQADWCCHKHDCCYEKAELSGCSPKMGRYEWKCEDNNVECENLEDRCQKMMCKCDSEAAKCLGKASYNPYNIFWPDFLCGQDHPTCSYY